MSQRFAKSRSGYCVAVLVVTVITLLPASPASAAGKKFFGVVPVNTPEADEFQLMGEARVGTYRLQLNWAAIQPTEEGGYDWSGPDEVISSAALNGMRVLPFAYGTPSYAADSLREAPVGSRDARRGWKSFLGEAVTRYGPDGSFWDEFATENPGAKPRPIKAWQIWNEQNSPSYYEPKPSPKKYGKLVKISHKAITAVHPGADILLGGMFGTPNRKNAIFSWRFLRKLYKVKRVKRKFDTVALHPYSPDRRGIREQIKRVRKVIRKRGRKKTPIWITELGWGSAGTEGHPLIKSEKGQKKMLKQSFDLILKKKGKWKVRRLLWFTWRDPEDPTDPVGVVCTWCASAGLLDGSGSPKPSYNQFRKFTGAK